MSETKEISQIASLFFCFLSSLPTNKRIIFISREGLFLKKIYDLICSRRNLRNNSLHFCISREALAKGLAYVEGGVALAANQPSAEKDYLKIISQRFGIAYLTLIDIKSKSSTAEEFYFNVKKHIERFKDAAILNYIELFGFKDDDVIVDIGYRGFIQYGLELITGLKFSGCYLCFNKSHFPINGKSFLSGKSKKIFYENRLFFEILMNGDSRSLSEVVSDDFTNFKFVYKEVPKNIPKEILKIRELILSFSKNFNLNDLEYFRRKNEIQNFQFSSYLKGKKIYLEDDFGGAKQRKITYE